jgi:uncharacterized protein (DUF2384 family)
MDSSEQIQYLQNEIKILAYEVLGEESYLQWLSEPNLFTNNEPPINMLDTAAGCEYVKNLLFCIEYGILA